MPLAELDPHYLRQVILVDVGVEGQRRIVEAAAPVGGEGLAHDVATRYAERAGFAEITPGSIDVGASDLAVVVSDAAAAVLVGSRAALRAILAAVKGPAEG
jgi:hypothetical protein